MDETPDGMVITGPTRLHGGMVDAHRDHRMAMTFAVAGLIASEPVTVAGLGGGRGLLPRLRGHPEGAVPVTGPVIAVDGPAGVRKEHDRPGARRAAGRHTRRHRCDVPGAGPQGSPLAGDTRRFKKVAGCSSTSTEISVGDGKVLLDGENVARLIRSAEVTAASSRVAEMPAVRNWMVDRQRAIAAPAGGAVVEGRDIGTVVLPDADLKIYLTASERERARRRVCSRPAPRPREPRRR